MKNLTLLLMSSILLIFLTPFNTNSQTHGPKTKRVFLSQEHILSYINGTCISDNTPAGNLPVDIREDFFNNLSSLEARIHLTSAFHLALGTAPHQHSIKDNLPIPEGWHHIAHYPMTQHKLIGKNLPLVNFCR